MGNLFPLARLCIPGKWEMSLFKPKDKNSVGVKRVAVASLPPPASLIGSDYVSSTLHHYKFSQIILQMCIFQRNPCGMFNRQQSLGIHEKCLDSHSWQACGKNSDFILNREPATFLPVFLDHSSLFYALCTCKLIQNAIKEWRIKEYLCQIIWQERHKIDKFNLSLLLFNLFINK